MTAAEMHDFLHQRHTMNVATINHDGTIHLVAMWYGFLDGAPAFQTFTKSQKIQNLRRDGRITALVEAGDSYGELRGVELVGRGEVIDDPDVVVAVAREVVERYLPAGPPEQMEIAATRMAQKRSAVRIDVRRSVTWDHRKLGSGS